MGEGPLLKRMLKKYKNSIFIIVIILFVLAGLLDIKYEGLLFQLLPKSIQSYLADIFH